MLALWPVAVIHCKLGALSGLEFLRCAAEAEKSSDCKGDGCETVEGATYKVPDQQKVLPQPLLVPALLSAVAIIPTGELFEKAFVLRCPPPPELPKTWQFASRAAPPVRAPS